MKEQKNKKNKLRAPGVEPGTPAWKAGMLPLHHARFVDFCSATCGHPVTKGAK